MKAITNYTYGGPEVLQLEEVDKPVPARDEVLVKVHAVSINPLDWHIMRGTPLFMRLMTGLTKPTRFNILGADIAGTVEQAGADVERLKVGDHVFGDIFNEGLGGLAEYVCVKGDDLVHIPENMTFHEAAGVPVAALTAWHGLRKFGALIAGQKVLVNGASGGVGTFAVQMAKASGAQVTGVCSTKNVPLVRSIGADEVIDYTNDNLTDSDQKYDLIFDAIGNYSLLEYRKLLTPDGRCAVVGFGGLSHMVQVGLFGGRRIKMVDFKANQQDLNSVRALIVAGKLKTVVDRSYALEESMEAIRYLETSRARGKVIISVVNKT